VPETEYSATVITGQTGGSDNSETHEYSWRFKTGKNRHNSLISVVSTDPPANATSVPVASSLTVTFNQELTTAMKKTTSVVLKKGQTSVEGSISFSGSTAIFRSSVNLTPNTVYSGIVKMAAMSNNDSNNHGENYSWSFTTGEGAIDVTAPSVSSVIPANSATTVTTGSTYKVTFSEPMDPATITAATITLNQGTVAVAGTVTYSGVVATFTPSSALAPNTVYTGTVTTGVKDAAGNALATNFTSGFTTAEAAPTDVISPTVIAVTPLNNATSVAVASGVTFTFSEAMNSTTVNSTTFTLKQGTNSVSGTVSYSGTTATFTPAAVLTGNTVYTGTITTGVKDVSGNALAANYTWSFTTVTTIALLSFANDVVPVLTLCNNCHTHPWTTSPVASTFYTNLVNGGYVDPASPTTSKIYTKLNSGHPGSSMKTADINKILNWMTEGSKNN
jgi:hypothetical protein